MVFQHFVLLYNSRFVPGDFTLPPGTVLASSPAWSDVEVTYTIPFDESVYRDFVPLLSSGYPLPTFSVRSGSSLPNGLQLSDSGVVSGLPLTPGVVETSLVATNASGGATLLVVWDVREIQYASGAANSDVRQAQIYLNGTDCPVAQSGPGSSGQETSYFGTKTQSAIRCYQLLHQMPVTGTLSPSLLAHLAANYTPPPPPPQLRSCSAQTISYCVLGGTPDAGVGGSCAAGYDGSCSYRCADGVWQRVSNTCSIPPRSQEGICDVSRSQGCVIGTPVQHDTSYISWGERWRCRGS